MSAFDAVDRSRLLFRVNSRLGLAWRWTAALPPEAVIVDWPVEVWNVVLPRFGGHLE